MRFPLGYPVSKMHFPRISLSLAIVAVAIVNASRVAAAASQKEGDVPWSAPQSTLQRQGGGVIRGCPQMGG